MVFKNDYGVQWILTQYALVINTMYLFGFAPYYEDGFADYMNTVFLLLIMTWQITYSQWISDPVQRNFNGMIYDGLFGLCFVINFGYVLVVSVNPIILHIKRAHFRYNKKKADKLKQQLVQYRIYSNPFSILENHVPIKRGPSIVVDERFSIRKPQESQIRNDHSIQSPQSKSV